MRKIILKIYISLALVAVGYILWYKITGIGISCYYQSVYGYECPGCGLSRMAFSIMKFEFRQAFFFNPVGFIAFVVWNAVALLCLSEKIRFTRKPTFLYGLLALTVASFLIQGLLRNLY